MTAAESAPLTLRSYFSAQRELYSQADAETIGPELERLADAGVTKAGEIVDAARPTDAPLHPYFEWDDRRAAEHFRQLQASRMTRSIVVKTVRDGEPVQELAFRPTAIRIVRSEATTVPPSAAPPIPQAPVTAPGRGGQPGTHRSIRVAEVGMAQTSPARVRPEPWHERTSREFVPEPGHSTWKDSQDPSLPTLAASLGGVNPSKLADDELIVRAMARLLGFQDTYASERKRECFEAIFGPVFVAIEQAGKRLALEGETAT